MAARQGSRIVASGCTSGLGIAAVRHLLQTTPGNLPPPYHIVLLARNNSPKSPAASALNELAAISKAIDSTSTVDVVPCDLSSLSSVKEAASDILKHLSDAQFTGPWRDIAPGRIDVLFLNAAVAKTERSLISTAPNGVAESAASGADIFRDPQGRYEETALVNHVAPQYLVAHLLPHMLQQDGPKPPRVAFTGSLLHRNAENPTSLDYFSLSPPSERQWAMMKSYSASKFLQVIGVQQLVRLLQSKFRGEEAEAKVEVVLVEPGFIPNTGLSRDSSFLVRLLMHYVMPYAPLPFVQSLQEGSANLARAFSQPLETLMPSKRHTPPEQGKWDGKTVTDGVRCVLISKEGSKCLPDERTAEESLGAKWWPQVVSEQWESKVGKA